MFDFKQITDWKLQKGSHEFPGPDGGTCINEAAIVAAGFEYRAIETATDCPPCFSRPIAQFAILLNDVMPEEHRQELMQFVTKLSGTADTEAVEWRRLEILMLALGREFIPRVLTMNGYPQGVRYSMGRSVEEYAYIIDQMKALPPSQRWYHKDLWCLDALGDFESAVGRFLRPSGQPRMRFIKSIYFDPSGPDAMMPERNVEHDFVAVAMMAGTCLAKLMKSLPYSESLSLWGRAIEVFKVMLDIGKQADAIDACTVNDRFTEIKKGVEKAAKAHKAKHYDELNEEFKSYELKPKTIYFSEAENPEIWWADDDLAFKKFTPEQEEQQTKAQFLTKDIVEKALATMAA